MEPEGREVEGRRDGCMYVDLAREKIHTHTQVM